MPPTVQELSCAPADRRRDGTERSLPRDCQMVGEQQGRGMLVVPAQRSMTYSPQLAPV